jgi:hypothetical protein
MQGEKTQGYGAACNIKSGLVTEEKQPQERVLIFIIPGLSFRLTTTAQGSWQYYPNSRTTAVPNYDGNLQPPTV